MLQRREELFEMAEEMGVEILNAKCKDDSHIEAIHILNPDMEALEKAIFDASDMFPAVVIHSRQTWIYKTSLDKVEVKQKLLA